MSISFKHKKEQAIETKPGCWNYTLVGIYMVTLDEEGVVTTEAKVGEYQRNYSNAGPFAAFELKGKWYALYSKEYMYTRVMSLPDCVDLGGEDKCNTPYSNHFCPSEYYIPVLCVQDFAEGEVDPVPYNPRHHTDDWAEKKAIKGATYYIWPDCKESNSTPEFKKQYEEAKAKSDVEHRSHMDRHPFVSKYAQFGFMQGCPWGMPYTLEFWDLRGADRGVIKRDSRFGYFELPEGNTLRQAIDIDLIEDYWDWSNMTITIAKPFRVQVDGTHKAWWVDEKFKKLKEKYKDRLFPEQLDELKALFKVFYLKGLDDNGSGGPNDDHLEELIGIFLKARPISRFKKLLKRALSD